MNRASRTILALGFIIILFTQFLFIPRYTTFAQNSEPDEAIYAVSNHGEKVDFKALANEIAKAKNLDAFMAKQIPSFIPNNLMPLQEQELVPDSVIGPDGRLKVNDTTYFPWTTVVKIHGNFKNESLDCTGWMLGVSTVATAAHCLYDFGGQNVFASNLVITPALNSDSVDSTPFGSCEWDRLWITNLWQTTGNHKYDYGVIGLKCRVGEETGYLSYKTMTDAQIDGQPVNVTGYPLDKGGTTMWFGLGNVLESHPDYLYYDNDTAGGQSGAPVWELVSDSCLDCVVAIHIAPGAGDFNVGVRITDDLFDFLYVMQRGCKILCVSGSEYNERVPKHKGKNENQH